MKGTEREIDIFRTFFNSVIMKTFFIWSSCLFRANIVVQCESWWNLAKQFASRSPPLHLLSSSVQRSLMKALVLGGFAHMDSDTKQQYWAEVMCIETKNKQCVSKYDPK